MTTSDFFYNVNNEGVETTLRKLASQSPEGELQMKRLEGLSKDLKLGLVTLANAAITRNRIALGILSLLENADDDAEVHSKLSEILRDYLEVSETEESASKAKANAEHERIEQNRRKYHHELPEPDLSPVPKSSLATLEDIRKMIASSQVELALRHTLTLVQGTDFFEKAEILGGQYKLLFGHRRLHLITDEAAGLEEIRITKALIEVLESFEKAPGWKGNSFWGGIRKWLK